MCGIAWLGHEMSLNRDQDSETNRVEPGRIGSLIYFPCVRGLRSYRQPVAIQNQNRHMHPNRGPDSGKWCRAPYMEDESG